MKDAEDNPSEEADKRYPWEVYDTPRDQRPRFSWGCLLGIVLMLAFLMLISMPVGNSRPPNARKIKAMAAMKGLQTGIVGFVTEYNHLPVVKGSVHEDQVLLSEGQMLTVLLSHRPTELNPRNIKFYDPPTGKNGRDGAIQQPDGSWKLFDPWGRLYLIHLDINDDGMIANPEKPGANIVSRALLYSAGPDGDPKTWKDNVRTWE